MSQYTSPRSIAFCLQRQPISCLQCDCRRKFSIVERLQVAQFLLLWPSWWFLCYWDIFLLVRLTFFISYRQSSSSPFDKRRRQPNQCKQRLHVLEENANIFCQCSNKCPTCNKALDEL